MMDSFLDPLHLCIATGPVAVYLVLLGFIHLLHRPLMTTGTRDTAALGVAISGFVIVGPMQLFLPESAVIRWGANVWILLLAFYILCLTLIILLVRPRLVIYNIKADQLRPLLASVVSRIDPQARWAGESLVLPQLNVHLHLEPSDSLRCVQLVSTGPHQDYGGWRKLELALSQELAELSVRRSPYGLPLIASGLLIGFAITAWMIQDPKLVAQSLREMLRL